MENLTSESSYLSAFIIAAVTILVLVGVVIIQNRRIREYNQPKFGFLGKPLSVVMIALVLGGGYLFVDYAAKQQPENVEVSADREISIEVIITETDPDLNDYILNAVPTVDREEWGRDDEVFDIYWTITTADGVETDVEMNLTEGNPGGLEIRLPRGRARIKATLFLDDEVIEKETTIDVE